MAYREIAFRVLGFIFLAALLVLFGPEALRAQDSSRPQEAGAESPGTVDSEDSGDQGDSEDSEEGSSWRDHFSLHGYFTVAYADLNLPAGERRTSEQVLRGIEEGGTFPYGNAALNLRYDPSFRHSFVLQVAHREFGDSPLGNLVDDLQLDWLFYQFDINDKSWLRLGRQPVSAGIFNEIRDVGVILPFFRPPLSFYREGSLFSETVDGIGYAHELFWGRPWSLDISAYYGEYEIIEPGAGFTDTITEVQATDALGAQLWLNTPLQGLRFGLGSQRWTVGKESGFSTQEEDWSSWFGSVDGEFERFVVRGEYQRLAVDLKGGFIPGLEVAVDFYYFQFGWLPTERLSFYVQPEYSDVIQRAPIFLGGETRSRNIQDLGFSAVFAFSARLVLKFEYHELDSQEPIGNEFVFTPQGPRVRPIYRSLQSDYSILSISLSF